MQKFVPSETLEIGNPNLSFVSTCGGCLISLKGLMYDISMTFCKLKLQEPYDTRQNPFRKGWSVPTYDIRGTQGYTTPVSPSDCHWSSFSSLVWWCGVIRVKSPFVGLWERVCYCVNKEINDILLYSSLRENIYLRRSTQRVPKSQLQTNVKFHYLSK